MKAITDRFRPGDRGALALWLGAWLGVMFVVAVAPRALPALFDSRPYLDRWAQWDAVRFTKLATYGYDGPPWEKFDPGWPAFFPGYPLALRAVGALVGDLRAAGLLISLVAGAVAVVALARLGNDAERAQVTDATSGEGGERAPSGRLGTMAVVAMLAGPGAVFLFAGYSESLFLAFALPAWLCARRGQWMWAGLLAMPASAVRITGLFLVLAMLVEYAVGAHGRRSGGLRPAGWLVLPFLPLAAYTFYQWTRTGDWMAWQHAQEAGWDRKFTMPWDALDLTWQAAFAVDNEFTLAFRIELAAAAVGVALTVFLLLRRRWPEATYVGLQLVALMTSSYYLSIGRATLLWWPLWLALGGMAVRWPRAFAGLVAAALPFAVLQLLTFTSGAWAG
ncbi:hypothetical protein [Actinomadura kijaniata]|uniref:hypothetical protein n=1 Tax=Actinomadura kijaniata TaxID=46161 RepID=UPI00082EF130|nr:hypothetical protein [Actinomadura kijaniata]